MNNLTEFYTDTVTGQPIRFKVIGYEIELVRGGILVFYQKETYNVDSTILIKTENMHYTINDEGDNTDFTDWVNYVTKPDETLQDIFFGATLPTILEIHGLA